MITKKGPPDKGLFVFPMNVPDGQECVNVYGAAGVFPRPGHHLVEALSEGHMTKPSEGNHQKLMKRVLSDKVSSKKRAKAFEKLYFDHVNKEGNDLGWNEYRTLLRRRHAKVPHERQRGKYGLDAGSLRRAYRNLRKKTPRGGRNAFPTAIFYHISFSVIKKLAGRGAKILEVGFGDDPAFLQLLNKEGYSAYGIEPFSKRCDNRRTFKATMRNLPEMLGRKYDLILANMVYCVYYTYNFPTHFTWELNHKQALLKKMFSLLKSGGYLVLVDDVGTVFSKNDLAKYFKIILFENDIPPLRCDGVTIEGIARITLLQKRDR